MTALDLSVVIPAFNEEARIRETIQAVAAYLQASGITHEIILVDDGSTDRTVEVTRSLATAHPVLRIVQARHQGKGGAVGTGVRQARGASVLFMDADHSTRIEEWEKCAQALAEGFAVVIGSRKMPGAEVRVHQPPLREAMGKVFTWLSNAMLGTAVTDVTCGFKCFQASAARRIFALQRIPGWGFDAELLFVARRLGFRVKEVPVTWTDDPSTRVRLASDAIRSFRELLQIRASAIRGHYPRQQAGPPR